MWPKYLDLNIEKIIAYEDEFWFVDIMTNILYRYSLVEKKLNKELDIRTLFDYEIKARSYTVGVIYKKRIIIFPVAGKCIIDYDIKSKIAKCFHLECSDIAPESDIANDFKFRLCVNIGNILWLIPAACHHLVSFNLDSGEIKDYTEWYSGLREYGWDNIYQFGSGIYYKKSLWFPCTQNNIIVEFNTNDKKVSLHKIGSMDNRYSAVCFHNDYLFAVECTNKQLYKIDSKDNIEENYAIPDRYDVSDVFLSIADGDKISCCSYMASVDDYILGIPGYGNSFFVFSDAKKEIELIPKVRHDDVYISYERYNGNLLIPSQNCGKIDLFETDTMSISNVVDKFFNIESTNKENCIVYEKNNTINDLIEYILVENDDKTVSSSEENAGARIFKKMGD